MNLGIKIGFCIFNFTIKVPKRCYFNNIRSMKSLKLSETNDEMPTLGLGTWQVCRKLVFL